MMTKRDKVLSIILTVFMLGQVVFAILLYNRSGSDPVRNIGWGLLWVSAVLGWLPILTFRRKGMVKKGKSYMYTTKLVDSGIYSVVRHPQYLAGIVICVSIMLIAQNWQAVVCGAAAASLFYITTYDADKDCVSKFGEEYEEYMTRVPRINIITGLLRRLSGK
jgi:protein-S-isoprenylcysteine O-methyltransferase Ste14